MGKVKDIYIRYEQGGDMFVGRALSGLPLLLAQFSASPAVFIKSESAEVGITTWILSATKAFPMMIGTPVIGNIAEICFSAIVFHRAKVEMWDHSHPMRQSTLFRVAEVGLEFASNHTRVLYPWDPEPSILVFRGIPPHVALLQEVQGLQRLILGLVDQFDERLTKQLDQRQINGGMLGETRMIDLIRQGTSDLRAAVAAAGQNSLHSGAELAIINGGPGITGRDGTTMIAPKRFTLHMYGGQFHVLPQTWRLPMSLGPLDLWMQWWLEDVRNDVPPLKILQGRDVYHLDFIMAEEGRGTTRKACKILCDIRFLMVYLENKVRATGSGLKLIQCPQFWQCIMK